MHISEIFACNTCYGPVAHTETPAGEQVYECQNPRCRRTVHIDCYEALALVEDVALHLHANEIRARIVANDKAGKDTWQDVIELMTIDPAFDIGIAKLIQTTIDVVEHGQQRTATIEAIRYQAIAA